MLFWFILKQLIDLGTIFLTWEIYEYQGLNLISLQLFQYWFNRIYKYINLSLFT